jgi:NarL family two-component system response regulator LiaR
VKKTILVYGLAIAIFVFVLQYLEYRLLIRDLSTEFYIGTIAVLFTGLGIWVGLRLTIAKKAAPETLFAINETELLRLGISKREHEVLGLMAQGLSNQEIGDKLFVSLNTIKTHTSNLFLKLDVSRRTQAVQKARQLKLIP